MAKKTENIETIHDRIALCVQQFGKGKNTVFAEKMGVSEGNIRGYIKGVVPKADVLENIVRTYDVSPEWLLTGRGEMLKTNDIVETTPQSTPIVEDLHLLNKNTKKNEDSQDNPQLFSQLLETVKQQAEEIGRLKARINELERSKGVDAGDVQSSGIANVG